jgi:hypothetical protein
MGTAHAAVTRELLVRYLDVVTPAVLHHAKRFTYAEGYPGSGADPSAVAALRVFGEFTDLLTKGRRLDVVLAGDGSAAEAVRAEIGAPPGLRVVSGQGPLADVLRESGAFKGPVVAYLDPAGAEPPDAGTLTALATGPQTDVLLLLDGGGPDRGGLHGAGFPAVVHVDLVDAAGQARTLYFASTAGKNLDRFKDALWAVDEFAGVRYRDPVDPDGALLDISLQAHLGPLKRALLARVRVGGPCQVAELREFTRAGTIYRAADATRALTALLSSGALGREPERGRLNPDTLVRLAR